MLRRTRRRRQAVAEPSASDARCPRRQRSAVHVAASGAINVTTSGGGTEARPSAGLGTEGVRQGGCDEGVLPCSRRACGSVYLRPLAVACCFARFVFDPPRATLATSAGFGRFASTCAVTADIGSSRNTELDNTAAKRVCGWVSEHRRRRASNAGNGPSQQRRPACVRPCARLLRRALGTAAPP